MGERTFEFSATHTTRASRQVIGILLEMSTKPGTTLYLDSTGCQILANDSLLAEISGAEAVKLIECFGATEHLPPTLARARPTESKHYLLYNVTCL